MAKMLPTYISDEIKSTGEKQIFTYFENDPETKDWIVLHSLNLPQHINRMYGEVDFVVLAPKLGVFCLEVKSGNIERKNGIWKYTNRYGKSEEKTRGPFQQAQEGMFSILDAIKKKHGQGSRLYKILFGYGVMFPHIVFRSNGIEEEQEQIYDRNSRRFPINTYVKRLALVTRKKAEKRGWFDDSSLPTKKDIEELVSFLRGDFEKIIDPIQTLDDCEEKLDTYTHEQFNCLDQISDNSRCVIQGAAGTGKTMIALESVRRALAENKRVLLLCYNSLLANWLSMQFIESTYKDKLYVGTLHSLMMKICIEAGQNIPKPPNSDTFFKYDLPLYALEAIDKGEIEPFDKLIIDEGQDLITQEYLDVLDSLLLGGIAGGNWGMFCDFEKQAIYTENTKDQMIDLLKSRSSFINFKLNINCRNTRPIGEEIALICGLEKSAFLTNKVNGLSVEYYYYENNNDQLDKLKNILYRFKKQSIPANKISLLSPNKFESSISCHVDKSIYQIKDLKNFQSWNNKFLSFSTIHSFKGMENSFVILTDLDKINGEDFIKLLYIGMSRARVGLYVLLSKETEKDFKNIVRNAISRMA